jgi:rhodanese-related sulfurtransferase
MFGIQEIDAAGLSAMLDDETQTPLLVDVRTPGEMAQGVLPGAVAVPMHLVPLKLEEWRNHRKIVFYCRTGARSGQVCAFMQQQGLDNAINLRGGISDWFRNGLPIETPASAVLAG